MHVLENMVGRDFATHVLRSTEGITEQEHVVTSNLILQYIFIS